MALSSKSEQLLAALAEGWTLKSHRHLDGTKIYQLHPLTGSRPVVVHAEIVAVLRDQGLIDSNKKFPAATYLLTEKGRSRVDALSKSKNIPLAATGW